MWRVLGLALLLAGCQIRPADPIAWATAEAQRSRFLRALIELDRLPPSDERYTQARTLAQALERRIRTSYQKVLEGLALRNEWRDEEALSRFLEALDIWPDVLAARGLIRATEHRIVAIGDDRATPSRPVADLTTQRVGEVTTSPILGDESPPQAPMGETPPTVTHHLPDTVAFGTGSQRADPTPKRIARTPLQEMRRRKLLGQIATLMRNGEMDRALDILEGLWVETPWDRVIARQFVRVLHQRALLAYGQGRLKAAIEGWRQVVRLAPEHAQAKAFMLAARTELMARKR